MKKLTIFNPVHSETLDVDGLTLDVGAMESLTGRVARRVAKAHRKAVAGGLKADGSGRQEPLLRGAQKRLADKGLRPIVRGVTAAGRFPVSIVAIGKGDRYEVSAPGHEAFLSVELSRGVEYLYSGGAIGAIISDEVHAALDSLFQ